MRTLPVFTAALLCSITVSVAEEAAPPGAGNLRQLLQQGLFEEEANRDTGKAAAAYSTIVAEYETQRSFAATALFRLAEIRAKQGKKEEAIALHQRLLTEFPKSEELGKLSKERIAALGGTLPAIATQADAPTDAEAKELMQLREIVQNSPDLLNSPGGEKNTTPLIRAATNGWLIAASFLLDHRADVNQSFNSTPLHAAAEQGHKRMVELLLARGADVDQKYGAATALYKACEHNRLEVAKVLLEHGAAPNVVITDVSEPDTGTPLQAAILQGNILLVRLLLDYKADPNPLNASGRPPLATAVNRQNEAAVKELLARGADVNVSSSDKWTALHFALNGGVWPDIVPLLLDHGASVKAVAPVTFPGGSTIGGRTPLHFAMSAFPLPWSVSQPGTMVGSGEQRESQMLKGAELTRLYKLWDALLAKGADINARDDNEETPLHLAATRRDLPVDALVWLVEHGADLDAKDKEGASVLDYARSVGFDRGLELERRYRFPKWSKKDAITLLNYVIGKQAPPLTIEPTGQAEAPPALREILLKTFENLKGNGPVQFNARVYRAQENGEFVELARVSVTSDAAALDSVKMPALQWGDLLVFGPEKDSRFDKRRIRTLPSKP